jgi:hypothetical protein
MSTVLRFRASTRTESRKPSKAGRACEIVIFPGVRIERHDPAAALDLGYRLPHPAGAEDFDGMGGTPRPRRTN